MSGITLSKASSMTQLIIGANVSAMNLCEMKTFQAFNSTNAYVVCVFYVSCLLILWTLSKCYCVKCSRISQISGSYLLQGSAATHLRYDGQCFTKFVANFSENTTVKNCESILKIGQHKRMYGGTVFFDSRCTRVIHFWKWSVFWPHLHTSFRLVPTSVTLNDHDRRNNPYFALFHRIR